MQWAGRESKFLVVLGNTLFRAGKNKTAPSCWEWCWERKKALQREISKALIFMVSPTGIEPVAYSLGGYMKTFSVEFYFFIVNHFSY